MIEFWRLHTHRFRVSFVKELYLQWICAEVIVGRVFVLLGVVKNLVSIDGPFTSNPHVKLLVKDAFLG